MADCFDGGPEKDNFYPFFTEQVKKFQEKTSSWPSEKITYLTTEENWNPMFAKIISVCVWKESFKNKSIISLSLQLDNNY